MNKYYSFFVLFFYTNFFFLLQRKICYGEQEIMQMQDYMRKPRTILPHPVTDFSLYMHKLPTSLLQNARMFMGIRDFPIDILTRSVRNTMTFQWLSYLPWGNSFFFFFFLNLFNAWFILESHIAEIFVVRNAVHSD